MRVAMSGATGFIGTHLTKSFQQLGWQVIPIRRDYLGTGEESLIRVMEEADAVINLAGAPIAARWTEDYKKVMYDSRISTTKKIVHALGVATKKPGVFISTSAIGIYDSAGAHTEEEGGYAEDFLARLAFDWEQAALEAKQLGIRTVIFRLGIVLGTGGGVLGKLLIPFRLGLGGVIGDGRQPLSWVHIDDLVHAYFTVIKDSNFAGVYNLTAPHPATNKELVKALGHAIHKPAFLHIPGFVFKLQLGEGADVLLKGQRVLPKRLLDSGFTFRFTKIEEAVEDLIRRL